MQIYTLPMQEIELTPRLVETVPEAARTAIIAHSQLTTENKEHHHTAFFSFHNHHLY